jgi:hypothetical protein
MTDRELLERAAKAAGIVGDYECWAGQGFMEGIRRKGNPKEYKIWNPLMYDDQALRLAVKLRLTIEHKENCVNVWDGCIGTGFVPNEDDPYAATRRAITRAAAAMGGE